MRAVGFVIALLVGCSHGASPPEPIANQGSATPVAVDAPPADASACVADCIRHNQMRATGPEVIAAECRTECLGK